MSIGAVQSCLLFLLILSLYIIRRIDPLLSVAMHPSYPNEANSDAGISTLPAELRRNFTLMRELDQRSQVRRPFLSISCLFCQ